MKGSVCPFFVVCPKRLELVCIKVVLHKMCVYISFLYCVCVVKQKVCVCVCTVCRFTFFIVLLYWSERRSHSHQEPFKKLIG